MASLQERLDEFKKSFEAGTPPYNVPHEVIETMHRATAESEFRRRCTQLWCRFESSQIGHYFNGEKSVGRMYVESIFSTSLLACSDLITS